MPALAGHFFASFSFSLYFQSWLIPSTGFSPSFLSLRHNSTPCLTDVAIAERFVKLHVQIKWATSQMVDLL